VRRTVRRGANQYRTARQAADKIYAMATQDRWLPIPPGDQRLRQTVSPLTLNPALSSRQLRQLASSAYIPVRTGVAAHPACPSRTLGQLSRDVSAQVRQAVAANPATSGRVLNRLADSVNEQERMLVAANRSCPPKALRRLADDKHNSVRAVVASNPSVPLPILLRLASTDCPANYDPVFLSFVGGDPRAATHNMLAGVASNPTCPPWLLHRYSNHAAASIRRAVAGNRSCPVEVLTELLRDTDTGVAATAAANPGLPRRILSMWQLTRGC
jgi:hypothetical protein